MAEALVFSAVEKIGSALADGALKPFCSFLFRKALPPEEVHSRLNLLKSELNIMKTYVKFIDTEKEGDEILESWAKELKFVAYQVDDIIDMYTYLSGSEQQRTGLRDSLRKTFRVYKNLKAWNNINTELEEVNKKLVNLSKIKERYDVKKDASTSSNTIQKHRRLAESTHFLEEDEIVGFEDYKHHLIELLTDDEASRSVVSIWGMGGLGKTTLATSIYGSSAIKRHFDSKAWVFVSQSYTAENLLKKIINQFFEENDETLTVEIDSMPFRGLVNILQDYLKNKKYLLVLDDVWNPIVWFEVKVALLECNCGSRIILTTRIHDVAAIAMEGGRGSRIIELEPLKELDSWVLFCKKAFWRSECPRELEHWARKIVERCQGLPLAIVAIGSLLSLRRTESEWQEVYQELHWERSDAQMLSWVENVLKLSFKDLPYYLRSCFLYCSIFPEDFPIKRKRLIRLWVAEGFVKEEGGKSMEEVAENYLKELVHRCLLQVTRRNHFGRPKSCRMHDIIRNLAVTLSSKEGFCMVYDHEVDSIDHARRLSVHKGGNIDLPVQREVSRICSLFLFEKSNSLPSFLMPMRDTFRLLRVLDLEGTLIGSLPKEVTELFNLRYLGLRKTKIRTLPKSLGRLRNLQTLDLYDSDIQAVPKGITKLTKLRHLFVESIGDLTFTELSSDPGVQTPRGIWNLKNLHTLESIQADEEMAGKIGSLRQLRSLRITRVKASHGRDLCASLSKMSHLVSLDVAGYDETEELALETWSPSSPSLVKKLELRGRLRGGVLPGWSASLVNLQNLGLSWSGLNEDPLQTLQALPNLVVLGLYKAYEGKELCFHGGGFAKLKLLMLGGSSNLDLVTIEKGAMPKLSELCLLRCRGMRFVPRGIEHLTGLQFLQLIDMPEEFIKWLRGGNGNGNVENRWTVAHIPVIKHIFQREGQWVSERL